MWHCEDGTFVLNRSSLHGFSVSPLLMLGFNLPFIIIVLQILCDSEGVIYIPRFTCHWRTILCWTISGTAQGLSLCSVRGLHWPHSTTAKQHCQHCHVQVLGPAEQPHGLQTPTPLPPVQPLGKSEGGTGRNESSICTVKTFCVWTKQQLLSESQFFCKTHGLFNQI